jgi:WD40 repeat protein
LLTVSGTATAVAPALLPGGRAVLFGLIDNDLERVAVLDLETGQQKTLIEGGQNAVYSATGHIVFARGTTLMAVPFNAMELAVTGEPVALVRDVRHPTTQSAADFALSESGTLIYVPSGGEGARSTVVWVDRSGQVVGRAIGEPVENPRDPALSPDGTRLALTIGPPSDGDVWSYDLRGRPPIRLAVADDDRSPVWSPDATQVLFTILSRGDADLYVSPADGSVVTPRPLRTQRVSAFVRVWSPAGELFMIRPSFATNDITVMPAAAAGETRDVVATEFWDVDPALSPNGRWLAYSSNRTGQFEVWVRGYPDGVVVRISNDWGIEPRWSADGRELFYLRGNAMMAVAVETDGEFSFAAPVQLFNRPYFMTAEPSVNSYDVAGDGRFLMIERAAGGSENGGLASIVVVENWFEELKRRVPTN